MKGSNQKDRVQGHIAWWLSDRILQSGDLGLNLN